jgi:hypothetical protein
MNAPLVIQDLRRKSDMKPEKESRRKEQNGTIHRISPAGVNRMSTRKIQFIILFLLTLVIAIAGSGGSRAFGQEGAVDPANTPPAQPVAGFLEGLPRWPVPDRPIPHHEPGRPSTAAGYRTTVTQINALGQEEPVQLTGLDALLEDGVIDDPLQGNRRLVNRDKLLVGNYHDLNQLTLQSYELVFPTLKPIDQTSADMGDYRFYDIAAADLNGDLVDEQLAAWIDPALDPRGDYGKIRLSAGDLIGNATSSPAVFVDGGDIHQLVRGYDSALWYHNGDPKSAVWSRSTTSGTMLSGPAVAAQSKDKFDVFFVTFADKEEVCPQGPDEKCYPKLALVRFKWAGGWQPLQRIDLPEEQALKQVVPLPELPAPAATTSNGQLDLFWLAPDNTLRWIHNDGAAWGAWQNLGGLLASAPGAVAHDGVIDVLARGVDDALWQITQNSSGVWSAWQRVDRPGMPEGVTIASAPSVVSPAANDLLVTVLGSDEQLWQLEYVGGTWEAWHGAGVNKSAPGKIGRALALDGDAQWAGVFDYVELPAKFPDTADFTFAAWVYREGDDPSQRIFDFGQDATKNMFLTPKSNDDKLRFAITDSGPLKEEQLNAPALDPDQWYHVAVTLEGDQGKLYLDGAEVDGGEIKLNPEKVLGNHNWLGRSQYDLDPGFKGKIDEVAIFDRALSPDQISGIYQKGWSAEDKPIMGLHMDEDPATHGLVVRDVSPFGNDGTLRNFHGGSFVGAPAVAVQGAQVDIFGLMDDGYLGRRQFDGSTWSEWVDYGHLPVGQRVTTLEEETVFLRHAHGDLENLSLDMAEGSFTGDGREQVALAYEATEGRITIVIYDMYGGFVPYKMAKLPAPIEGIVPRITAADVDGDGADEIGLAYVLVEPNKDWHRYKVAVYDVKVDNEWPFDLEEFVDKDTGIILDSPIFHMQSEGDDYDFAGTLKITSGNFVKDDVRPDVRPNEEIAVLSDWLYWYTNPGDSKEDYHSWYQLYILDGDYPVNKDFCKASEDDCPYALSWADWADNDIHSGNRFNTGAALGAGNVIGEGAKDVESEGYDQIVMSWPKNFEDGDYPDQVRYLRVLDAKEYDPTNKIIKEDPNKRPGLEDLIADDMWLPGPDWSWARYTYLDTLAVGDLVWGEKLQDEIVFYDEAEDKLVVYGDYYYDYQEEEYRLKLIAEAPSNSGDDQKISLAMGDFTGEALRVGRPTYRKEREIGGLIAVINDPPKHIGVNSDDDDTYASYQDEDKQSTTMSIQVTRDWGIASSLEITAGDPEGSHVTASVGNTYGENFENTTTEFSSFTFGSDITTAGDDMIKYSRTNYWVWEYPLYNEKGERADGYITVVFPEPGSSNHGTEDVHAPGTDCDLTYRPNHQLFNVWSYPASTSQFTDYSKPVSTHTWTFSSLIGRFTTGWESGMEEYDSSGVHLGFSAGVEAQTGGDKIPLVDKKIPWSMKASVEGTYNKDELSSQTVSFQESTWVTAFFNKLNNPAAGAGYEVKSYLYWADDGYLVMDYTTKPGSGAFWAPYTKGDPAFIRPWADGHCGADRVNFSKDIAVTPAFVNNAEEITISATVRNFSPVDITTVKVRFYQGDPAQGGQQLGEATLQDPFLKRGRETVSITTTIEGSGEQHIYAVIDAGGPDREMDTSNNKAYGVLVMGESKYVDPGAVGRQPYAPLALEGEVGVMAHVPPGKLGQTTRFEIRESENSYANILGRPFELLAYQGDAEEGGWNNPVDGGLDLTPGDNDPPAAIMIDFAGRDLTGLEADELTLWYDTGLKWIVANETCGQDNQNKPLYPILDFPDLLAVPICKTGEFVIASTPPEPPEPTGNDLYMPLVMKK